MKRSFSQTRDLVALQWEPAKASPELGYVLTHNLLNPKASLDSQTEQKRSSSQSCPLPFPKHTARERGTHCASSQEPCKKLQTPAELKQPGVVQAGNWGPQSWILGAKHPEVFLTLQTCPYSFWWQEYNSFLLCSNRKTEQLGTLQLVY